MANDPLRPAYVDRIEMTVGGTAEDAVAALEAGVMDVVWNPIIAPTLPATAVAAFEAANGPGRVHVDDYDYVSSVAMNLAVPPFDDVHVRKAVNHAVDKRSLIDALGGPLAVDAAGHLAIDSLEANLLLDRHFYGAADRGADVEAARAEMTLSRYDSDGDGRCDSQTCEGIPVLARGDTAEIADSVREDLAEIGIAVAVEVMPPRDVYPRWYDPRSKVAMLIGGGWSKAYLGAASFFAEQFYGPFLGDQQGNGTLVGAASDQLQAWGYDVTDVPNVDRRIEGCIPLVGDAQFECWAALDQYMMEEVVPVAPYAFGRFVTVTSDRVADYAFDQLTTGPAFEQIALNQ
jgi:ABC-type transport system substrate-binding protein